MVTIKSISIADEREIKVTLEELKLMVKASRNLAEAYNLVDSTREQIRNRCTTDASHEERMDFYKNGYMVISDFMYSFERTDRKIEILYD